MKAKAMVEIPDQKAAAERLLHELKVSGVTGCEECDQLDLFALLDSMACGGLMLVENSREASEAYMKEIQKAALTQAE